MLFYLSKHLLSLLKSKKILVKKILLKGGQKKTKKTFSFFEKKILMKNIKKIIFFNKKDFKKYSHHTFNIFKNLIIKKKKKKNLKCYKHLIKILFIKKISSPEISFYIKKIIKVFLEKHNNQIKKVRKQLKKKIVLISNKQSLLKSSALKKNEIMVFKKLYFILKNQKTLTAKIHFELEKKFFKILFKRKKNLKNFRQKTCIQNLLIAYFKKSKKKKMRINNFLKYKKVFFNKLKRTKTITTSFYDKLTGLMTKNGNKILAKKIVNKALNLTSLKLKRPTNFILSKVFKILDTQVEVKQVKLGKRLYFVPYPVKFERNTFLISKWIIKSVKKEKIKKNTAFRLHLEFVKLLKRKYTLSFSTRKFNICTALDHKSNIHFRW